MRSTAAPNRRLSRLTVHLWLTLAVSLLLAGSFAFYVRAEKRIDAANEQRQQSAFLANQLRQSSDELTRMARTYVATGELQYRTQFEQIVAVREGHLPRSGKQPVNYWEVLPADARQDGAAAGALPLMALIRRAGFAPQEIALLQQAKARSDALTATEWAAMRLVEAGQPSPAAARAQASAMLHGEAYHHAKDGILAPIRQFSLLADQRTLALVQHSEQRAFALRVVFLCLVAMLLGMVWMARGEVLAVLGGSVPQLYQHIVRLGSGDFASPPPAAPRDSVLAWVGQTQQRLAQAEAERKQAEAELAQYRSRLEQLVEERTQALADALHRAEAASRAKSVFLSNMSHELRTPLNAVIGFSDLMARSGSLSEDERENLRFIHHAGKHLLALIDQVLALSRTDPEHASLVDGLGAVAQLGAQPSDQPSDQPSEQPSGSAAGIAALSQAEVQALDDATYLALCNAVQHLDRKGLSQLLLRVAPSHPALACSIEAMAERQAYRELWDALQQARSAGTPAR